MGAVTFEADDYSDTLGKVVLLDGKKIGRVHCYGKARWGNAPSFPDRDGRHIRSTPGIYATRKTAAQALVTIYEAVNR